MLVPSIISYSPAAFDAIQNDYDGMCSLCKNLWLD